MFPNFLGANIIWVFIKSKMNIIWFVQHILLSTKTWIRSLCHQRWILFDLFNIYYYQPRLESEVCVIKDEYYLICSTYIIINQDLNQKSVSSKMNIIWFVQHILLSTKTWIRSLCHHHFKHILCYILDSSWCTTEEHKPRPALLWNQAECSLHLSKDIKIIWTNAVSCAQLELKISHHGNGSARINGLINTKRLPWGQQTVHCASCGTLHHTRLHPPSHTSSTHWNR